MVLNLGDLIEAALEAERIKEIERQMAESATDEPEPTPPEAPLR